MSKDGTRIQTWGGPKSFVQRFKKKKIGISILEVDNVALLALIY